MTTYHYLTDELPVRFAKFMRMDWKCQACKPREIKMSAIEKVAKAIGCQAEICRADGQPVDKCKFCLKISKAAIEATFEVISDWANDKGISFDDTADLSKRLVGE